MTENTTTVTFLLRKNDYELSIDKKISDKLKNKIIKTMKLNSIFATSLPEEFKILVSPGNCFIKKNTFSLKRKQDDEKLKNIFPCYEIVNGENNLRFVKDTNIENLNLKLNFYYQEKKIDSKDIVASLEIEFG